MNAKCVPHKRTGLLRGDATKIARIHRVSRWHVAEVAAGRREGREALVETIRRYQDKAREAAQAEEAA